MTTAISQQLPKGQFFHDTVLLVSGTAIAHVISVIVLPLLTRLYSPEDFSFFAAYSAILIILSAGACLRLDIALPLPERDDEAVNLLALTLLFSLMTSTIVAGIVFLVPNFIANLLHQKKILSYLWLLPMGVLIDSVYNATRYWVIRQKRFKNIAIISVEQSAMVAVSQVTMGIFGLKSSGLILSQLVNSGTGIFGLLTDMVNHPTFSLNYISPKKMIHILKEYKQFPIYSTPEVLSNTAAMQLPLIIIASLAVGPEAGFLMLAMKVTQVPMKLIGSSIAQVYFSNAADEYRKNNLNAFTMEVVTRLFNVGTGPLVFAGIIAPTVFSIIFGIDWHRSGLLVSWMIPWFAIQFIASPISTVMYITNRQRQMLGITFLGLLLRTGSVLIALAIMPSYVSEYYAVSGALFYSTCLYFFLNAAGINIKTFIGILKHSYNIIIWASLGIFFVYIIGWII